MKKIAIIGLGYVGLPLARLFATKYPVVGFDINQNRIDELRSGTDTTLEVADEVLQKVLVKDFSDLNNKMGSPNPVETGNVVPSGVDANNDIPNNVIPSGVEGEEYSFQTGLLCSSDANDIADCNIYIVTVPTPVDRHNRPDLTPLYRSSETVAKVLKKGDIVIYESTVYPGVTEGECVPILEKISGLTYNIDFFAGYSPERINPGDKEHTVEKILKVTAGSTPEIGEVVNELYKSVITAGTHLAPSIEVAEAAKVIENSQRDINIAFVNELAKIFNLMGIDTQAVLEAAGTKWNFLPFKPGLVGGHCIGVDPYYLAQRAQEFGYHPEIILAGRKLNDSMGEYVASQVVKLMIKKGIVINSAKVLIMGITFKENCPDVRNTKIIDVINSLKEYGININVFDPNADVQEVLSEYGLQISNDLPNEKFDAVVLGVAHKEFLSLPFDSIMKSVAVLYDVKGVLGNKVDGKL